MPLRWKRLSSALRPKPQTRPLRLSLLLLALVTILGAGILFACSQTPTSVPIRTFERAQRVDTICLRLAGPDAPAAQPPEACAPVPPDVNGINLDNQLFALVTQSSRGEVAVVDLSAGQVVDRSKAVPGINFLPVGAIPTDIAATPDGRMAFVASAEPNKFAIYGIPGHRILGDFIAGFTGKPDPEGTLSLGSWPVCTLPQRPGSLTVVPRGTLNDLAAYEVVAVLPGSSTDTAKIITIDPKPFLRASPHKDANGVAEDFGAGDKLTPGTPQPCPITSAIELAGDPADGGVAAVPSSFMPGKRWEDGVKWVDGGVDLTCARADQALRCGGRACGCPAVVVGPDGGAPLEDAGACEPDAGDPTTAPVAVDPGPLDPPLPVAIARDDKILYVADDALPLVHVIDLSTPGAPRELPPFVVSSVADPDRVATIRDVAVSPPTREYKRFLYAVDRKDGTVAVFDVSDLATAERTPMRRPHPELNPFQPEDRLAFGAPVVSIAFARHDWPLKKSAGFTLPASQSGVLCNPNSNLVASPSPPDYGASFRANSQDTDVSLGPARLRGIFAFATLANGQIVAIDVDDWDAPCRRPEKLEGPAAAVLDNSNTPTGLLAVPQPPAAAGDLDPYHAPEAAPGSVTREAFFPVSAPHRIRSTFFLRNDNTTGNHIPFLVSQPRIQGTGAPLAQSGPGSEGTPKLRPTTTRPGRSTGTENIDVLFSFDVPDVHFDQDWIVQYEGQLPGFRGLPAPLSTTDEHNSLVLTQEQAKFCAKGVEDWTVGGERARAVEAALRQSGRAVPAESLVPRMMDYVQLVDELLPESDPFWSIGEDPNAPDACWVSEPTPGARQVIPPQERYPTCSRYFGTAAQQLPSRDFPILEAYDDHLVLGRFGKTSSGPNVTREAIYSHPSNKAELRLARCCFHRQVNFVIRGGSQWITTGSTLGFMSHLTTDAQNRCVPSCDPRESLLNGRAPSLPYTPNAPDFAPHRDTPLAMRNPSFSFFIQNGFVFNADAQGQVNAQPTRDTYYSFSTRGQFTPLIIDLAGGTGSISVNPQSMRFIESLGQIAVVDSASQGLVLLDLGTVGIARAPYF